ncbi:MAG TPA: zinc-binding dehydrogenase [Gemmatimonadaceae bacterium]|nr:zinc-binding dehydrogenase [Gemmatimonadaceae bacterium]
MRALTVSAHGGLEQLQVVADLRIPALDSPTSVRVRMHAVALNHLDLFVLRGLPGMSLSPNWVVCADGAGVVDAVGEAVQTFAPGDRVMINPGISDRTCSFCLAGEQSLCENFRLLGEQLPGTAAELVVVPAANLRIVPPAVSWEHAAAFSLATLTAWRVVVTRARLQPGETMLIWGIGGGVAIAALQIAKRIGARVWVTSGSDAKLAGARELGADETFNHRTGDVVRDIRERTGRRGVHVVLDDVGEATWERSLRVLGRGGRLVTCGATSGPMVQTDVRKLFWHQWTIMGSTMGNDRELDAVVQALGEGALVPVVDAVYPLEEARAAYERLSNGDQFGKIVLRLRDD